MPYCFSFFLRQVISVTSTSLVCVAQRLEEGFFTSGPFAGLGAFCTEAVPDEFGRVRFLTDTVVVGGSVQGLLDDVIAAEDIFNDVVPVFTRSPPVS